MTVIHQRSLGETLYLGIDKNQYLNKLYHKLLVIFSKTSLNLDYECDLFTQKELKDLLIFADILSMSTLPKKSGAHKVWAQQIVSFLKFLYQNEYDSIKKNEYTELISFYSSRVFNNCTNYEAINKQDITYATTSLTDSLYDFSKQEYLKIPNTDDKFFILEQKTIYDELEKGNLSYSAPTSMGKSFIMRVFIKNKIKNKSKENFSILVPTKSLINEFKRKLLYELKEILNVNNYRVVTSSGDIVLEQEHHFIFIMTPERLLYLINQKPSIKINYLFIDEAHKICSKDDGRSSFYYQLVNSLSKRENKPFIYFSSPNIPNPEIYKDLIPSKQLINKFTYFSPVNQISYSIDIEKETLRQYNEHSKEFIEFPLPNNMKTLNSLINYVTKNDKQTLVYSNSVHSTIQYAKDLADTLQYTNNKDLELLARDVEQQIHRDYFLVNLLKKGIAFHVGYLPASIKYRIEKAFIEGKIKVIFCTSTLLEGVNLPADNLIITSYKNGRDKLTTVGFKNLIGRVGRLEYSMFGNVFLYPMNDTSKVSNFENMLIKPVENQKLSIETTLNQEQKSQVLKSLLSESKIITKDKDTTYDEYIFMIKMSLLIVDNIRNNNDDSLVVNSFISKDKEDKVNKIKNNFKNEPILDTLDLTFDQYRNIKLAIEKGLHYPKLCKRNGKLAIDFSKTKDFLLLLYEIFKWDIYESKNIASKNLIGYYAKILNQWMSGFGMTNILEMSLKYKKDHPTDGIYSGNRKVKIIYNDIDKNDKNLVIAEVLNILEHTIIFTFGNYFRIFSSEYKKIHKIPENERLENDWYEYVEYGTINSKIIELQRIGYSRESSTIILKNKGKYIQNIPNKTLSFSLSLCDLKSSSDEGLKLETEDILINTPEIFI